MGGIGDFLFGAIPDFVWGVVAFVLFVLVLYRMGIKNILVAVDAREGRIRAQMEAAASAAAAAAIRQEKLDAEFAAVEDKIRAMMAEARRDAAVLRERAIEEGQAEVESQRAQALREIDAARHQAVLDLRREMADIGLLMAGRAIDAELDRERHRELVERALDDYVNAQAGV
ncbi:MAG: hypothetical protein ACOCYV_02485 [Planctomycetota bacterium]